MKTALAVFFAALFLLLPAAFALSSQAQSLDLNASEIQSLVRVNGSLDFNPFVPYQENRASVGVSLSIPPSSFSTLTAGELSVYVSLTPRRNDSLLYFRNATSKGRAYYFSLTCKVSSSGCADGSTVSRTVLVYFNAPSAAPLQGDGLLVNASLFPFLDAQQGGDGASEFVANETVSPAIADLQDRIGRLVSFLWVGGASPSLSPAASNDSLARQAAELAASAKESLSRGDVASAQRYLNESETALNRSRTQAALGPSAAPSPPADPEAGFLTALTQPPLPYVALALVALALFVKFAEHGRGKEEAPFLD